jgi:hypothetical protein
MDTPTINFFPTAPQQFELPEEIGLEGLNVRGMSNYLSGYVSNLANLLSAKVLPTGLLKSDTDVAVKILSTLKRTELEHFTIYTPEYISKNYVKYLEHLHYILTSLKDIDSRLLTPLNVWALNMATTPGYGEKVWILPAFSKAVEDNSKSLKIFFNNSPGSGLAERRYEEIFRDVTTLKKVNTLIEDLTAMCHKLLEGNLYQKSTDLAKNIKRLTEFKGIENHMDSLPVEKAELISALTWQAAKELELIATTIHLVKVAECAQDETLKKIKKQLG